jgi:hypothetical protein
MPLQKKTIVDLVTVDEAGSVSVRTATVVEENDVELSRSFHRHVLAPGDDLAGQDARVAAIADATWTPDVVADWQAFIAARDE